MFHPSGPNFLLSYDFQFQAFYMNYCLNDSISFCTKFHSKQHTWTTVCRKDTAKSIGFHWTMLLTSRKSWVIPAYVLFKPAFIPWGGSFVNLIDVYNVEETYEKYKTTTTHHQLITLFSVYLDLKYIHSILHVCLAISCTSFTRYWTDDIFYVQFDSWILKVT
jgi:hypothetical protein